jgi:hypothetical protein
MILLGGIECGRGRENWNRSWNVGRSVRSCGRAVGRLELVGCSVVQLNAGESSLVSLKFQ